MVTYSLKSSNHVWLSVSVRLLPVVAQHRLLLKTKTFSLGQVQGNKHEMEKGPAWREISTTSIYNSRRYNLMTVLSQTRQQEVEVLGVNAQAEDRS